jgi:hypothetical protein
VYLLFHVFCVTLLYFFWLRKNMAHFSSSDGSKAHLHISYMCVCEGSDICKTPAELLLVSPSRLADSVQFGFKRQAEC